MYDDGHTPPGVGLGLRQTDLAVNGRPRVRDLLPGYVSKSSLSKRIKAWDNSKMLAQISSHHDSYHSDSPRLARGIMSKKAPKDSLFIPFPVHTTTSPLRQGIIGWQTHLGGDFMNSTPFVMLPFRPS